MSDGALDWPKDRAGINLLDAMLIFKGTFGAKEFRTFMVAELSREICLGELAERHKRLLAFAEAREAAKHSSGRLSVALTVLRFYASGAGDGGAIARETLAVIGGE